MSWDASRKSSASAWAQSPYGLSRTSLLPSILDPLWGNNFRPANFSTNWFFGFPGSQSAARLRHYVWGHNPYRVQSLIREVGGPRPDDFTENYLFPSTEQFYLGAQTFCQMPWIWLASTDSQVNPVSVAPLQIYAGITADGRLWSWGMTSATHNPLGLGSDGDIVIRPAGTVISKFFRHTPQLVLGENDELANVQFRKVLTVGVSAMVALSVDGDLYCSGVAETGNSPSVFGRGDYWTSGSVGVRSFHYPKLVKNCTLVGSTVTCPSTSHKWQDFAVTPGLQCYAIKSGGKLYRLGSNFTTPSGEVGLHSINGRVNTLTITDGGDGYSNDDLASLTITATESPTGDNLTFDASKTLIAASNKITRLHVTNQGSGYVTPPTITISAPTNTFPYTVKRAAQATCTISPTEWKAVFANTNMSSDNGIAIDSAGDLYGLNTSLTDAAFNTTQAAVRNFFVSRIAAGSNLAIAGGVERAQYPVYGLNSSGALVGITFGGSVVTVSPGPWLDLAVGHAHVAVRNANGEVWTLGSGQFGQFGNGNTGSSASSATLVKVSGDAVWKAIFPGGKSTLAIRDEQLDQFGTRVNPLPYAR